MHLIWNDPNTKLQMPYEMLIFLFVTLSRLVLCVIVAKFIWVFWNTYVAIEKTTSLSNKMALKPQDLFQNEIVISETEANCQAKISSKVFVSLESFLSEVWQLLVGVAGLVAAPVSSTSHQLCRHDGWSVSPNFGLQPIKNILQPAAACSPAVHSQPLSRKCRQLFGWLHLQFTCNCCTFWSGKIKIQNLRDCR